MSGLFFPSFVLPEQTYSFKNKKICSFTAETIGIIFNRPYLTSLMYMSKVLLSSFISH